jgi:hypothetical protein
MSLEIILMLLFAAAAWTHLVASLAEDEAARRHWQFTSGAMAVAIVAGVLATTIAFEVIGERHLEHMPNSFGWFGFAVGVVTYLWIAWHDARRKERSQARQPLTPDAPPTPPSSDLRRMLDTPPDAPLVEVVYRWHQDPQGEPPVSPASVPESAAPTPPPPKQEN